MTLPLARVVLPDSRNPTAGILQISACRLGCYLTAGRGHVGIPVNDGPELRSVLNQLRFARYGDISEVEIGGELWVIDCSLREHVAAALSSMIAAIDAAEANLLRSSSDEAFGEDE